MQVQDVNKLLKQFTEMQRMMKKMSGKGGMRKMMGQMKNMLPPGSVVAAAPSDCRVVMHTSRAHHGWALFMGPLVQKMAGLVAIITNPSRITRLILS